MAFGSDRKTSDNKSSASNRRGGRDKANDRNGDNGPLYCGLAAHIDINAPRGEVVPPAGGYVIIGAWLAGSGNGRENKLSCLMSASDVGEIREARVSAKNDGGEIAVGLGKHILLRYSIPRSVVGDVLTLLDKDARKGGEWELLVKKLNDILASAETEAPESA